MWAIKSPHNRYLFGEGVVCGLEVTCHPCGDGRVIVHPGYALDCCGNDLTLACAQTLDSNAMVRDLRRDQLGGYDCGDPCPEPETHTGGTPKKDPGPADDRRDTATSQQKTPLRYCLYIRYCEQSSDPVMPYSTGEDCGRVSCEPTRVREGVKFELRCRPRGDAANELIKRLCACLGDLNHLASAFDSLRRLRDGRRIATAATETAEISSVPPQALAIVFNDYEEAVKNSRAVGAERTAGGAPQKLTAIPGDFSRPEYIDALRKASASIRRIESFSAEERQKLPDDTVRKASEIKESISQTVTFAVTDSAAYFAEVRDWLIERLGNAPLITDCTLRQKVYAMGLPALKGQGQLGDYETRSFAASADMLAEAFINYLRDCVCRVLNPACAPCDDSGVLLACLDIEDCEVVKVCNLERTVVISPKAVRYWLPPVQLLGNLFERLCCDPLEKLLTDKKDNTLDVDIGRFDLADLLKEEITRILKDSLCLTSKDQLDPLKSRVDAMFTSRRAESVSSATGESSSSQKTASVVNSPNIAEKAASPDLTANEAASVEASKGVASFEASTVADVTSAATKKAKAKPTKKEAKKNGDETVAATTTTTPPVADAPTGGTEGVEK